MLWFSWVLLLLYTGAVTAFSIAPITVPVTKINEPITVTWFRSAQETEGFVLVKSIVKEGLPGREAIVTVSPERKQTSGEVTFSFYQSKTFVLHAVETNSKGKTESTFFTDTQTITVGPRIAITPATTTTTESSSSSSSSSSSPSSSPDPSISASRTQSEDRTAQVQETSSAQLSRSSSSSTIETETSGAALEKPSAASSTSSAPDDTESVASSSSNRKPNNKVIIIASTLSGIAVLILLLLLLLCLKRRKPKRFSTSTFGSGIFFDRDRMVKAPSPPTRKSGAYNPIQSPRSSTSTTPSFTETTITYETERPGARTDRQMEIEERIQSLQARLISSSRLSTEEILIRERIDKLHTLKGGKWALDKCDVRPLEMW